MSFGCFFVLPRIFLGGGCIAVFLLPATDSHGNQRASPWRWAAYVFNAGLRGQIGLKTLSAGVCLYAVIPVKAGIAMALALVLCRHSRAGGNRSALVTFRAKVKDKSDSRLRGNDGCEARPKAQSPKPKALGFKPPQSSLHGHKAHSSTATSRQLQLDPVATANLARLANERKRCRLPVRAFPVAVDLRTVTLARGQE